MKQTKAEVRKFALKNLGVAGGWILAAIVLLISGLTAHLHRLSLWPERALRDTGLLSGRWEALIPLTGFLGLVVFMTIHVGWLLLIPPALFMLVSGRRSKLLEKLFAVAPFEARPETQERDRLTEALMFSEAGDHEEAVRRLRNALGDEDYDVPIRFYLAVELAETGDCRAAYTEMIRFLRDAKVTGFSPKVMIDAEGTARKLARRWEKQLRGILLTRIGRGRRLSVTCPNCSTRLKASFDVVDDVAVCTKCRTEFALPYGDTAGAGIKG